MLDFNGNKLLVPALLGLGILANKSEICLANNTSILIILFLLLQDKDKCEKHHDGCHHDGCRPGYPYGGDGIVALGGRLNAQTYCPIAGGCVHNPCSPCYQPCCHNPCCDNDRDRDRHHHHHRPRPF